MVLPAQEDMLEVLEADLLQKVTDAIQASSIAAQVHGVFSLDDLEKKTENDICGSIAIGVGYQGCTPITQHPPQGNPATGMTADLRKSGDFYFMVLVAAPVDVLCTQRLTATRLLTILRLAILGQHVNSGRAQRTWMFVQEKPEIAQSTDTMLYYTQVWRLVLPLMSK